jgi:hypothetical protein
MLLSNSWYDVVDKDLLWLYRCDGVRFKFGERVHQGNLDKTLVGNWSEFSHKKSSIPLIKGSDRMGYLILIARRHLSEEELFDLSKRLA